MAFRASRKSSATKTVTKTTTKDPVVTGSPVSVEDLVGAPTATGSLQKKSEGTALESLISKQKPSAVTVDRINQTEKSQPVPSEQTMKHSTVSTPVAQTPSASPSYSKPHGGQDSQRPSYSQRPSFPLRQGFEGQIEGQGEGHAPQRPSYEGQGRYSGGGGGYRRMPRRDFSYSENGNNGFTQDINVPTETVKGLLDTMPEGHGFLRPKFTPSDKDVYISVSQIRRFLLRNGDVVEGQARAPKENERYYGLLKVEKVNEILVDELKDRPKFEDLTPIYPNKQLILETSLFPISTRIIDLVAPIGFGQRGMIVSPPKAGKTTILKELAAGISANYPNVHLMAALIGERPEEVTDISRSVKGEVLASNFDESPSEQTRIAEVALDRAKRLVELGKDVVILLDSITRLARAYNLVVNPSGRTLSGGFDPAALYPAKRFLGAARCVEPNPEKGLGGGSLTVIGTALVETGSRMDDLIYEEFKGTGNMELHLSRVLQERRIFPAIDMGKSGTRHDELLLGEEKMKKVSTLRHMLSMLSDEERTMMFIDKMGKTKSNEEFLDSLSKG